VAAFPPAGHPALRHRLRPIWLARATYRQALRLTVSAGHLLYRRHDLRTSTSRKTTVVGSQRERLPAEIRVLVGTGFLVAVGYGIVAPALPAFARSFDVGVTAASAVVSGFALFRLIFAPVSGRLLHRLGELRVFCSGLLVVGLSSIACAFAADYTQLLAFRALGGVGSTMFTVAAASLLIKIAPAAMRGRAAAAWATGFLLGTVAGPVIGGSLAAISLRAPFVIYAFLLGLAAVISVVLLSGRVVSPGVTERGPAPALTFAAALREPTFRASLTTNFLNGWTVHGIRVALVPLFIIDILGASSSWSGAALTAFAAGTAGTLTLGGRLADRCGRRQPILVGSLVVAVTTLLLGMTGSPGVLLVICALSGVGTGLLTPPMNAAVADVLTAGGSTRSGPALAGFQMVGDVGAIVGPVLAGMAVELGGYPAAFTLTAVIAAVSLACWQRVGEAHYGRTPPYGQNAITAGSGCAG
jgi:MFS family permease